MGVATLAGQPFDIDPESVQWDFTIKKSVTHTLGGKVVQILGVDLGPMTITGSFGRGYFPAQRAFLERMRALADYQVDHYTEPPARFFFPLYNWDFLVYLKSYSSGDGASAIHLAPDVVNPTWRLTLQIVEDNSGLKKVAADAYIRRLANGIGWDQSKYNGPLTFQDVTTFLAGVGAADATDYVQQAYELDRAGGTGAPGTGMAAQITGDNARDAFTYFVVTCGLTAQQSAAICGNLQAESSIDPRANQPGGPGRGIAQWSEGDRWDSLVAFAQQQGEDPESLSFQLSYVWKELNEAYSSVLAALRATTTIQAGVDVILHDYEVAADRAPGGRNSVLRAQYAQAIYDQYAPTLTTSSTVQATP